jgi:hypothetical protein
MSKIDILNTSEDNKDDDTRSPVLRVINYDNLTPDESVEETVVTTTEEPAETIVHKIEEKLKPVTNVVTDLIHKAEQNSQVKNAIDNGLEQVRQQVVGHAVTLWCCFGWDLSLHIHRRKPKTSHGTHLGVSTSAIPPAPCTEPEVSLHPKPEYSS